MLGAGAIRTLGGSQPVLSVRCRADGWQGPGGWGSTAALDGDRSGAADAGLQLRLRARTGIEAISDSVIPSRPVEWRNAGRVLVVMVPLLATMFSGNSALAQHTRFADGETGRHFSIN